MVGFSDKYDLEEIDYGTTGWNGIQQTNNEKIDAGMQSRIIGVIGEIAAAYKAVYLKSDGKYWLAQGDGSKQPCLGLMVEDALADETKRFQRTGEMTNVLWSWIVGGVIYLSPNTPGGLTQTPPQSNAQIMGIAISTTKIFLTTIYMASLDIPSIYLVGGSYNGTPSASLILMRHPITNEAPVFPAGLSHSQMIAEVAATAETIFTLKKNGVAFGTATFAIGGTIPIFVAASETSFVEGDILTFEAPTPPDSTLSGLGWTFKGNRVNVTTTTSTTTTTTSTTTTTV